MSIIPPVSRECWFLSGPTAGGKTSVAIELARQLEAEIISMDSMAVYRRLDIGTAKPTQEQRQEVPHHLIDIVDPQEDFSLANYLQAAHRAVEDIHSRGRHVLFVGGTPLYLKSLLRGIFEGPPADWPLRRELAEAAESNPPGYLQARLAEVDPQSAARLHAADTRRLIRALEVYQKTGRPISAWQQQFAAGRRAEECHVFVLAWQREELNRRIEERVDAMFAAGLVAEVEALISAGIELSHTAGQALGYREVLDHLAGRMSLEETIALVKTRTRQFAKRQETWFRSLSECRRVAVTENTSTERICQEILAQ